MHPDYAYLLIGLGIFTIASFSIIAYLEKNYHNKNIDF